MDSKAVNASIATVNDCLRHLTWVKSDLASIRQVEVPAAGTTPSLFGAYPTIPNGAVSFGQNPAIPNGRTKYSGTNTPEQQPSFSNTSGNTKRRIDILATPQFAQVVRYVMKFSDSCKILALLWTIADGPLLKEDLEIVSNYIKVLEVDASVSRLEIDKAPEE